MSWSSFVLATACIILVSAGSHAAQQAKPSATTDSSEMYNRASPSATGQSGAASAAGGDRDAALHPGANSFTEAQARRRVETHGFRNVSQLVQGKDGIWRGYAEKDGKTVSVALDYRGNIVSRPR